MPEPAEKDAAPSRGEPRIDRTATLLMAYLVALGGFNHIVVGSTDMFYLVLEGSLSWGGYFTRFFTPTLIGNIIGGVTLVALLNHAQATSGDEEHAA